MASTTSDTDLADLLTRLETLLERVEDRLIVAQQLPLIRSTTLPTKPFLSDDLPTNQTLFSQPSFHITPGEPTS